MSCSIAGKYIFLRQITELDNNLNMNLAEVLVEIGNKNFVGGIVDISDCVDCNPGTYQDDAAKGNCSNCPTGWYQEEGGKPYCLPCIRKFFIFAAVSIFHFFSLCTCTSPGTSIVIRVPALYEYICVHNYFLKFIPFFRT